MRVAIIGAGISGSAFARWLVETRRHRGEHIEIVVFDKGRRPGGRASSQASPRDAAWEADFGAISFSWNPQADDLDDGGDTRLNLDPQVSRQLRDWIERGALTPAFSCLEGSQRSSTPRWVAPSGMGRFVAQILHDLPEVQLLTSHRVTQLRRGAHAQGDRSTVAWSIEGEISPGGEVFQERGFDFIVVTAPPPQAAELLSEVAPSYAQRLAQVQPYPQWVARFRGELPWLPTSIVELDHSESSAIARISAEGLKRGQVPKTGDELYCVQATPSWSARHIDLERDEIGALLAEELSALTAAKQPSSAPSPLVFERAHRWRFSGLTRPISGAGADLDPKLGLGCCGDSYSEGQLLGALNSAAKLLHDYQATWGLE